MPALPNIFQHGIIDVMEIYSGVAIDVKDERCLLLFWEVGHFGRVYEIAYIPEWAYYSFLGAGLIEMILV